MDFWTNRMFDEKCEDGSMQIKDNHGQNNISGKDPTICLSEVWTQSSKFILIILWKNNLLPVLGKT